MARTKYIKSDRRFVPVQVQKEQHIYELGSLPPLLLTFAGDIQVQKLFWVFQLERLC